MTPDEIAANISNLARDMRAILLEIREVVKYMKDAESEVPEKMRRFMMYLHDMHDVKFMYEELGHTVPKYIIREIERCDDRLRQLLDDMHSPDGAFERVRQEMTRRGGNRYDHTKLLGGGDETGNR